MAHQEQLTRNSRYVNNGISELLQANRSPIDGYKQSPSMTLEEASEKLAPFIDNLANYVADAKRKCNQYSTNLTWDESAAIYLYSMPISFFSRLNETLRAENRDALKPWFAFLKLFVAALEKLPSLEITVWRGFVSDVGFSLFENDLQIWWSVNSCSRALDVVGPYVGERGIVFAIGAIHAKDVSDYSAFPVEKEVILMPGTHVRVQSNSLNFDNRLFIVHLAEEPAPGKKPAW